MHLQLAKARAPTSFLSSNPHLQRSVLAAATSIVQPGPVWHRFVALAVFVGREGRTEDHRIDEAYEGTRDEVSVDVLYRRNAQNVVGSLSFPTTQRNGTHARGSASQYGFIETTEPRNAFWLLVSDFTSSARHPLTLPQIPSTRLAPTSPSLHLPRLLQVPLYSMTTNPNF